MITPGPTKLYLLSVSVARGAVPGVLVSLGIYTSDLVHVTLSSVGGELLFELYPSFFTALRFAGAAYLLYLAYKNFAKAVQGADPVTLDDKKAKEGLGNFYLSGLLVNLLNPFSLVFYFSLLPQFVSEEAKAGAGLQIFVLGGVMVTVFFLYHILIATLSGFIQTRLTTLKVGWFARAQAVVLGLIFCALALRIVSQ